MKKFRELSGKLVVAMLAVTLLIGCAIGGIGRPTDRQDRSCGQHLHLWGYQHHAGWKPLAPIIRSSLFVWTCQRPEGDGQRTPEACWLFISRWRKKVRLSRTRSPIPSLQAGRRAMARRFLPMSNITRLRHLMRTGPFGVLERFY